MSLHLKNAAARLIVVEVPGKEGAGSANTYTAAPGKTISIDGDLGNAKDYVDYLISSGQLVEVAAPKEVKETVETSKKTATATKQ